MREIEGSCALTSIAIDRRRGQELGVNPVHRNLLPLSSIYSALTYD